MTETTRGIIFCGLRQKSGSEVIKPFRALFSIKFQLLIRIFANNKDWSRLKLSDSQVLYSQEPNVIQLHHVCTKI